MKAGRAPGRVLLNLALDLALAATALPVALVLAPPPEGGPAAAWWGPALLAAVLALAAVALPLRLPRQYWRYVGLPDLLPLLGACLAAALLFRGALATGALGWAPANPAFPLLHAGVLAALLGGARVAGRLRHAGRGPPEQDPSRPVILAGGAGTADLFIRALAARRAPGWRVVGILASRARQTGRRVLGVPILGATEEAGAVLDRLRSENRSPGMVILTDPALAGPRLEALVDAADRHGIPVRRAPGPTELDRAAEDGRAGDDRPRMDLRPVAIEELLDRPQVPLDREGMARLVQGRRVLVTGAGGTIGSELARQIAALGPAALTLLDHGEFALYGIDLELSERHPGVARRSVLADVRDAPRVRRLVEELRPDLVFHAAALKHVPMVENDPLEGLLTNALGTRIVADAARAGGCRAMVFISTDKAVNPTSVMGATKRLAEMYCQALDVAARAPRGTVAGSARAGGEMRCVTVRFGNVLGSTGSVVPLFRRQLERGGPLTVTHPDMRRYFMTVREAVGLVLQASVVGAEETGSGDGPHHDRGADGDLGTMLRDGGIFVLDMGKPVKIVDLARRMIRMAGLTPDEDVEIRFTGLRPGEKLFEELFHGQEPPRPTRYPGLLVATPRTSDAALVGRAMDEIAAAARAGNARLALAGLARMVPEFEHAPNLPAAGRGGAGP